jgi:hypothetical protein
VNVAPLPAEGKFEVISDTPWPGEKVRVFFFGVQGWPQCAAERWALVSALERFGTLTGWGKEAHNPGTFGFTLVPTYDLRPATYTSDYLYFTSKEIKAHDNSDLDRFDAEEEDIVNRYDPRGRFPFLFINGQYTLTGPAGYSPGLIDGQEFDAVYQQLASGERNAATEAIKAEANLITKYICHSTGGQPAAACQQ